MLNIMKAQHTCTYSAQYSEWIAPSMLDDLALLAAVQGTAIMKAQL